MKTIVLYYSRTKKTSKVASTLAKEVSADLVEIEDLKNRLGPFNYINASIDAMRENKTNIKPSTVDISEYGLIYVGTPEWAGKPAPAIITLIDKCDFQGKDVILFATLGGSGGKNAIERMREKIEIRGGRMVTSFLIKTAGKKMFEIGEETKKTVEEMDLKIYGV